MADSNNGQDLQTSSDHVTEMLPADVSPESVVEALLFSTDTPLSAQRLADIVGVGKPADIERQIQTLNGIYTERGSSFRIEAIAKGYRMMTLPVYNHWLARLHKERADSRLSQAALETLAIVAYKQPILRADIEAIRGVAVGDMLVRLREMNLVRIVGRAEEVGRPLLYGTTTRFLEIFGLHTLSDLPKMDDRSPNQFPALQIAPSD